MRFFMRYHVRESTPPWSSSSASNPKTEIFFPPHGGVHACHGLSPGKGVFSLLETLDRLVLKYGGRLYLCKDARIDREMFERTYPGADEFREIRKRYDLKGSLRSFLSERINI